MTRRTDKDFAIEFGGYMADSVDRLLAYLTTPGEADAEKALDLIRAVRLGVYEFRKRAKPRARRNAGEGS